jgi:DNA-binding transcriptional LysR family regulator
MELLALRTFEAVVDEGGILAASRKLNTVQSNVTARIRRLEEELGAELFFRSGRGVELAPAGRVLLDYARRMLNLERQIAAAVRQAGDEAGELRTTHPALELRVRADTSATLVDHVLAHKLDCAFVAGPVVHPALRFEELVVEELVQVFAPGTDPVLTPLILFREGCAYRARAIALQRTLGHAQADAMEFGTLEGILGCVSVGLGWTLMPRRIVAQSAHAPRLEMRDVPPEIGLVPTGMVSLKSDAPPRALTTLANLIRTQAAAR